ncbi:MFS transporter [Devosia sp. BSSL-BM10]|uniref:MFS transporter n=1 Tax=Devosia litorisediminis TaxID=2829817 RepID=A0A942I766_9HYPH|nr:MFS transporter [Devosia litorisediminis]MBS3849773.1 MFS transporter [Devosia litorisediminis]
MTGTIQGAADGMPMPRRALAFATILLAASSAAMDGVSVNVALPTLSSEFGITASTSVWAVNVYQLAVVTSLLPIAAMGDIVGHRRIYLIGLLVFAIMAGLAALSPNFELLILARTIQGFGAACILSINLALVRYIMPSSRLGRAIGLTAMAVAIASSIGPSIAGVLLAFGSWRWVFGVSLITGLISATVGLFTLPETNVQAKPFDFVSAALSATMFGSLLLGFSTIGHFWNVALTGALFLIGIAAGIALVIRLWDKPAPLLPLDLIRIPVFSLSVLASLCAFSAQMATYVSLPFYLQSSLGFSVLEAGLIFGAWPLALACTAPIAGTLADRLPAGILGFLGLGMLAMGLLILVVYPSTSTLWGMAWPLAICGFGFALFQSPNNRTILGSAPKARSGAAAGALATARLVGQALGTALATLAMSRVVGGGPTLPLVLAAVFAAIGACISVVRRGKVLVPSS